MSTVSRLTEALGSGMMADRALKSSALLEAKPFHDQSWKMIHQHHHRNRIISPPPSCFLPTNWALVVVVTINKNGGLPLVWGEVAS